MSAVVAAAVAHGENVGQTSAVVDQLPQRLLSAIGPQSLVQCCPYCGGSKLWRHGFFRCKDGTRVQRFRCQACGRSCNPATGTIEHRLQKRPEWREAMKGEAFEQPLRHMARALGVHLSTAFRWRHRLLAKLAAKRIPVQAGRVGVELAHVRYSEKGSRTGSGPGSWGNPYGSWLRMNRGPRSAAAVAAYQSRPWRHRSQRFRYFIDARPTVVLCVSTPGTQLSLPLGQRPAAFVALQERLVECIAQGSVVYGFGPSPCATACNAVGLPYQPVCGFREDEEIGDGETWTTMLTREMAQDHRRVQRPTTPYSWLQRFRGVATRYLHHYLAWFDHLTLSEQVPAEALLALC